MRASDLHKEFVTQGEHRVTTDPRIAYQTVLGSCIAVCARCPRTGAGGMNHFLLPADPSLDGDGQSRRFGAYAMEALLNEIIRAASGTRRGELELKAFGAGQIVRGLRNIGRMNIDFLEDYLRRDGLHLSGSGLGGVRARKVIYHPASGKAWVKELEPVAVEDLVAEEQAAAAAKPARAEVVAADVELF